MKAPFLQTFLLWSILLLGQSNGQDLYNLTVLHTNEVYGRIMPVDGYYLSECTLGPITEGADCTGSAASDCVLQVPSCFKKGRCNGCSGGIASRIKYIRDVRENGDNVISLDVGNYYFGSLWFQKFQGIASNQYLKNTDDAGNPLYDVMGAGHGEFFLGDDQLATILDKNPVPRLMANYEPREESSLHPSKCQTAFSVACIQSFSILERNGRKIIVVGVTSTLLMSKSSPTALDHKDNGDTDISIKKTIYDAQQAAPDANIVILLSTLTKIENEQLALRVDGIDAIITQTAGASTDQYPTMMHNIVSGSQVLIASSTSFGRHVGNLQLQFDEDGFLQGFTGEQVEINIPFDGNGDPVLEGNIDVVAWGTSKFEAGIVDAYKEARVGETSGAIFGPKGRDIDLDFECSTVTYTSDKDTACPSTNPLLTFGTFSDPDGGDGLPCCPFDASVEGALECHSGTCGPDVDLTTDEWSFPPSTACCPEREEQACCPKEAYWKVAGCRHSDCSIGHLVTEAMMYVCKDCLFAFQNGGGLRAEIGQGDVTYGDILTVLPFQNTMSYVTATPALVLEMLTRSVSEYYPGSAAGKLGHFSGLRAVWNPSTAEVLKVELCLQWDREKHECGNNEYEDLMANPARLIKFATSNYLRGGGDGYSMLVSKGNGVVDYTDLALLMDQVVKEFIESMDIYEPTSEQYIVDHCAGYHSNYIETFEKYPKCRLIKAETESPFKCPNRGLVECLEASTSSDEVIGTFQYQKGEINRMLNGTCTECSGYGRCSAIAGYVCECKPTLVEGFAFPRQYRDDTVGVVGPCGIAGDEGNHEGLVLTEGSSCETLATKVAPGGGILGMVYVFALICFLCGGVFYLILVKHAGHGVIKASQPMYLKVTCLGGVTGGAFCIVCASEPSVVSCNLVPILGSCTFALLMVPLCVKSQIVSTIFNAKKIKKITISHKTNMGIIAFFVSGEMLFCLALMAVFPFHPTVVKLDPKIAGLSYSVVCAVQDQFGTPMRMIWTISLLGINMLLVAAGLYYAVVIRNVVSAFNESKLIGFAIYNMTLSGLFFLPLIFVFEGNPPLSVLFRAALMTLLVLSTLGTFLASKWYNVSTISASVTVNQLAKGTTAGNATVTSMRTHKSGRPSGVAMTQGSHVSKT